MHHCTFNGGDFLIDSLFAVLIFQPINQLLGPPHLIPAVLLLHSKSDLASSKTWDLLAVIRCRIHQDDSAIDLSLVASAHGWV